MPRFPVWAVVFAIFLVLAVLVGLAVFVLIWRARKTFGLKD